VSHDERSCGAIDRRLGQRVRTRRLEIGMSQERLAELLGVTFQQVQKYEKGVNRMAASRLFAIAGALDYPIERFFHGIDPKAPRGAAAPDTDIEAMLATSDGVEMAGFWKRIKSKDARRSVLNICRAVAEAKAPFAMEAH
jgi:transcriptional regulator with XRE-family HTH domain